VAATLSPRASALFLALLVLAGSLGGGLLAAGGTAAAPGPALAPASASQVNGTVQGPKLLGPSGTGEYYVNGSGGPAFAANGTQIGNLSYFASVAGSNTTGVSITPGSAAIVNGSAPPATLQVNAVFQTLTLLVSISSVYQKQNVTLNLTYSIQVIQPYRIVATLVNHSNTTSVIGFNISIALDGTVVGNVTVPTIAARGEYNLSFQYLVLPLASGWHTFTLTILGGRGLISFANGATQYSQSFYIPGAPPNYELWYVVGVVAFVGVVFILATRVAARRRGQLRR